MKPSRIATILLGILLVNAAAILFFRYFITIDGPMHVLHASLQKAPWPSPEHAAHGFTYYCGMRSLGDAITAVLLLFLEPQHAHDVFATLVSSAVVIAAVAFLRAQGTRVGIPILWLVPVMFNTLFILGLFHFLLGVAISLGSVAWWKWHAEKPRIRWFGLLVGMALAWFTHRGAPALLCLFMFPTYLFELRQERRTAFLTDPRERNKWLASGAVILLIGAFQLHRVLEIINVPIPTSLPPFTRTSLLKTLFIFDQTKEKWLILGIGLLLLISIATGIWARWRLGRKLVWHDVLIILFLVLFAITWLTNSPHGRRLIVSDRVHWLALVVLVLWLIAIADNARGIAARIIGGAAICALPLQVIRLTQAERSFSTLEPSHMLTMEACAALEPNSIVLSVMAGSDRMQQHIQAYVATKHNGILVAPTEFLLSYGPYARTKKTDWLRFSRDPNWLLRHWREGIPPEVDQVLFIGQGIDQKVSKHPWPTLLGERFQPSFENEFARIYTAARDTSISTSR